MSEKLTRIEHSVRILSAIRAAEADGNDVYVANHCCGCSRMSLAIADAADEDLETELTIQEWK